MKNFLLPVAMTLLSVAAPYLVQAAGEVSLFEAREGGWYIKQELYNQANIDAGLHHFTANCAVCHGKDGSGNGLRAEVMIGAKPRNLTSVPWMRAHDDERLLRSITYGVPGTAMVAFGGEIPTRDRLQIVMYLRDQIDTNVAKSELEDSLSDSFDTGIAALQLQKKPNAEQIATLYKEKALYKLIGSQMAGKRLFELLTSLRDAIRSKKGRIEGTNPADSQERFAKATAAIRTDLLARITRAKATEAALQSQLPSTDRDTSLAAAKNETNFLEDFLVQVQFATEEMTALDAQVRTFTIRNVPEAPSGMQSSAPRDTNETNPE